MSSTLDQAQAPPRNGAAAPSLPRPRGPISAGLLSRLVDAPGLLPAVPGDVDPWGEDLQLALYCCYELHYRSFDGVDDGWEWHPALLAFRAQLERVFEQALRDAVPQPPSEDVVAALHELAVAPGPSLSRFVAEKGSRAQFEEFVVHRSPYQLKEADPHTWVIPRLHGRAKAAVVHVQMEEYGDGVEAAMHSTLFADVMDEMGLETAYGYYLDLVPATTLATTNIITMFGLHRRLRGALVGHLALFEMTSVGPMARYSAALARLGLGERARRFYDVHIEADEVHADIAANDMAGGLARDEPALGPDIIFGAQAATLVEGRFAVALLDAWHAGRCSLLAPLPC